MKLRSRSLAEAVALLGFFIAMGFLIFRLVSSRAAKGEFPSAETVMLVMLIVAWWSPETIFNRATPFKAIGMFLARASQGIEKKAKDRRTLKERVIWIIASTLGWFVLEWLAETQARTSFLDPTTQHLISYQASSLAFIAFVFLWIVWFPIFDTPMSGPHSTASDASPVKHFWRAIIVILGLLVAAYSAWRIRLLIYDPALSGMHKFNAIQHWLVRITLGLYIAIILGYFLRLWLMDRARRPNPA